VSFSTGNPLVQNPIKLVANIGDCFGRISFYDKRPYSGKPKQGTVKNRRFSVSAGG
jgi:hypothetical protein